MSAPAVSDLGARLAEAERRYVERNRESSASYDSTFGVKKPTRSR
jgi:hypothetical protein